VRIDEFFSWAPIIPVPEEVTSLHNARISAKRLRYTLELFDMVFGDAGKAAIDELRGIQEDFGLIHDLDVRIALIETEREDAPNDDIRSGLDRLLKGQIKSREQQHTAMVRHWTALIEAGFEDHLRALAK
jgi:CHAD domain-containing protein